MNKSNVSFAVLSVEAGGRHSAEISPEQEGQKGLISLTSTPPSPPPPPLLLLCSEVMKPKWNPFEAVKPAGN